MADQALNSDGSPASEQTLNTGTSSAPKAAGGLKSTIEFHQVKDASSDKTLKQEDPSKAEGKEPGDGKGKDKKHEDSVPYERFQQALERRDKEHSEEIGKLKAEIDSLKSGKQEDRSGDEDYKPQFKDMSSMKNEELTDWIEDDPLGFIKNLAAQIRYESWQDVMALNEHNTKASQQEKVKSTTQKAMEDFTKKNPDFADLKKSGKIRDFLKENPWHNEISAYYELTNESRVKSAEEKAKDAARKEADERQKAKQHARVLGAGPSSPAPSDGIPEELKDSKKYGGLTSVLAGRLAAMRRRTG